MRIAFAILIALHGLIHLIGPAKAFGWGNVTQLRQPISTAGGSVWLLAAVLLIASAVAVAISARWWSYVALPGVLLSQYLIFTAWDDAKFGSIANLIIFVPLAFLAIDARAASFRSRFASDRAALLTRPARPTPLVTDADLEPLPRLMQTYLRRSGVVGRPRVRNMRIAFDAQMRSSATSPWMTSTVQQYEFFDPPARLFYMNASRAGVPFDVYHRYVDSAATFQVRIASLIPMVDQHGPEMTKSETVTLLNDIVVMAPAAVLDLPFTWETLSDRTVRAIFSNAGYTVSAVLTFDAAGDLVGFVSNDRSELSGKTVKRLPWSTPISGYAEVNGIRVGTRGDANWIEPGGEWTYGRFTIRELAYNIRK
jgi:hypothetical protein